MIVLFTFGQRKRSVRRLEILRVFCIAAATAGLFVSVPSAHAISQEYENYTKYFGQSALLIYPSEFIADRFNHELGFRIGYQQGFGDSWYLDTTAKARLQNGIGGWNVRSGADIYPVRAFYSVSGLGEPPTFLAIFSFVCAGVFIESDRHVVSGTTYEDQFGFGWKYGCRFALENHVIFQLQTVSSYLSLKQPATVSLSVGVGYAIY